MLLKMIPEKIIREISKSKKEPSWMLEKRLKSLKIFNKLKMPDWGPELSKLKFDELTYFVKPGTKKARSWDDVPKDIKETFEKLGIPEAERKSLAGVGAQYESENVYHNLKKEWEEKGVIFLDMDEALIKYPEIVKKYFTKCVPITDHKFAALHYAVWSGGTFLYIPKNVKVTMPLQAYFRMNSPAMGQFEHTLIIIDEGAEAHYLEGCSAPQYTENNIHAGCVEVFVAKNARMRYSSVENWSRNTYNLNTKRAIVEDDGIIEWVGGNVGSGVTMLYPC
jgi:Fe-S cluster assembly protein SufB